MANQRMPTRDIEKYADSALKKWLKKVLSEPKLSKQVWNTRTRKGSRAFLQVELSIVTAAKMIKLNKEFRDKADVTDVLSFPSIEIFKQQGYLGDLVICAPVLLKQAKEFKQDWKQEVDVLLVHGILHLVGLDHEKSDRDALEMEKWERKILGKKYAGSLISRVGNEP